MTAETVTCKARLLNNDRSTWGTSRTCGAKATTAEGFCRRHDPALLQAKEDAERLRMQPLKDAEANLYRASTALTSYRAQLDSALRMAHSHELREQPRAYADDLVELRRLLLDLDAAKAAVEQRKSELSR